MTKLLVSLLLIASTTVFAADKKTRKVAQEEGQRDCVMTCQLVDDEEHGANIMDSCRVGQMAKTDNFKRLMACCPAIGSTEACQSKFPIPAR